MEKNDIEAEIYRLKERRREKDRIRYQKHCEERKAKQRRYYALHKDEIKYRRCTGAKSENSKRISCWKKREMRMRYIEEHNLIPLLSAAGIVPLSKGTLAQYKYLRRMPLEKIGGRYYVTPKDIRRWYDNYRLSRGNQ